MNQTENRVLTTQGTFWSVQLLPCPPPFTDCRMKQVSLVDNATCDVVAKTPRTALRSKGTQKESGEQLLSVMSVVVSLLLYSIIYSGDWSISKVCWEFVLFVPVMNSQTPRERNNVHKWSAKNISRCPLKEAPSTVLLRLIFTLFTMEIDAKIHADYWNVLSIYREARRTCPHNCPLIPAKEKNE